jgi:hypothetical protein
MRYEDSHLSDQQLLLDVDGELSAHDEKLVRAHLDACWTCRARRFELENTIASFIRFHQGELNTGLPPIAGPRARLKAQLAQFPSPPLHRFSSWFTSSRRFACVLAAACGLLAVAFITVRSSADRQSRSHLKAMVVSAPDSVLTPGAALLESRQAVCAQANAKNKMVPVALQRKVFEEYGIAGAEPQAYEVDYLITPALGGADDIHNLWPHSYTSTAWNAHVKDALEDHLRELVCDGSLDLVTAQKDIAENWIGAYKKYFHTDAPLKRHFGHEVR